MKRRWLCGAPLRYTLAIGFGLFAASLTIGLSGVLESFAARELEGQIEGDLSSRSCSPLWAPSRCASLTPPRPSSAATEPCSACSARM